MLSFARRNLPLTVFILAALPLTVALASQFLAGLVPCPLCHWQRYPYIVAMALALVAWVTDGNVRRTLAVLGALAILASGAIAAFHVGVEQKWWEGLYGCAGTIDFTGMTSEEMQAALQDTAPVRCDEPAWTMFGISMAGYNLIYALAAGLFVLAATVRGNSK